MVHALHRGQFDHVQADDFPRIRHRGDPLQGLVPAQPAGHRRARGGNHRRIQRVEIESDEDLLGKPAGNPVSRQVPERGHGGVPRRDGAAVRAAVFPLRVADRPQADLQQRAAQFMDAPQHAGMRDPPALVRLPQVGVRVEMDNADFPACRPEGADGPQRGRVLAAQDDGYRPGPQRPGHGFFDAAQPALAQIAPAGGRFHRRLGVDAQFPGAARAVEIVQLARRRQDGLRPARRAAAVADRGFHRRGNDLEARAVRRGVAENRIQEGNGFHGAPQVSK